jgi:pantoate--beta-alanine ligase
VPTVRESDGLAMSSRNKYLNVTERKAALCLYSSLMKAKHLVQSGQRDSKRVLREVHSIIKAEPLAKIEYVSIVDEETMKDIKRIGRKALLAMAVRIGRTRLIDNAIVSRR